MNHAYNGEIRFACPLVHHNRHLRRRRRRRVAEVEVESVANGDLEIWRRVAGEEKKDTESLTLDMTNSGGDLASMRGDGRGIDLDV